MDLTRLTPTTRQTTRALQVTRISYVYLQYQTNRCRTGNSVAESKFVGCRSVMSSRLMLPVTRSSPRKRLRLQDSPPERQTPLPIISSLYSPSPDKHRRSPVAKRLRLSPTSQQPTSSSVRPDVGIKALITPS